MLWWNWRYNIYTSNDNDSEAAIFVIVRKLGSKFVYEFCKEETVKKIENSNLFKNPKKIERIMAVLFFIPGTPKDLLTYIAGLLPIKMSRFLVISTLARIPSVIPSTLAGASINEWILETCNNNVRCNIPNSINNNGNLFFI